MVQPAQTTRPRRRTGVVVAAAALSAIIGAGAGIGSYAYLAGGDDRHRNLADQRDHPTGRQHPGPGRHHLGRGQGDRALGGHHHGHVQPGRVAGAGEVLDKQGHILTNDHVVAAAASGQGVRAVRTSPVRTSPARSSPVRSVSV